MFVAGALAASTVGASSAPVTATTMSGAASGHALAAAVASAASAPTFLNSPEHAWLVAIGSAIAAFALFLTHLVSLS